jgi:pyruvate formate lyase activating enzyme
MKANAKHGIPRRDFLARAGVACAGLACAKVWGGSLPPTAPLSAMPHEAQFYETLGDKSVRCGLCPRHCQVPDGQRGYCGVRENQGGRYATLVYGRCSAANLDPIEKKPFFHVHPGTKAYSIATVGCNLHCKFCQNWDIAQAGPEELTGPYRRPEDIAEAARRSGAKTLAYTYNEPTIFYEYMTDCARAARTLGLDSIVVSNGFIAEAPQKVLLPLVKAVKVDLKAFTPSFYSGVCDGLLEPVLASLKRLAASGVWLEIVCLLIPTLNDNPDETRRMAAWVVKELGPNVPLHFTRFHPMYRLKNLPPTPPEMLLRARAVAMEEGCRFVYSGNVPGLEGQDTLCPACRKPVIRRYGHRILENTLKAGACSACGAAIPGVWG